MADDDWMYWLGGIAVLLTLAYLITVLFRAGRPH